MRRESFDYSPFYKKFPLLLQEQIKPEAISLFCLAYIKKVLREGRIHRGINYHCSYVSLLKFKGNVCFSDITVSYLNEYENWLLNRNVFITIVGMYVVPLRTLFNEAIEDGIIKRERCYSFGRRKYKIPTSRNIKKALDLTGVKRIYYYQSDQDTPSGQRAKDFWLFSYCANGMNPKNIV